MDPKSAAGLMASLVSNRNPVLKTTDLVQRNGSIDGFTKEICKKMLKVWLCQQTFCSMRWFVLKMNACLQMESTVSRMLIGVLLCYWHCLAAFEMACLLTSAVLKTRLAGDMLTGCLLLVW